MTDEGRRTRLTLIVLSATVGLVVIAALVAVLVRGGPADFAEDTPAGVVQRYAQAVVDGDYTTALTYLTPEIAASCDRVSPGTSDYRLTLVDTVERESTARVNVVVTEVYGSGPLGPNEYRHDEVFELVSAGGEWRIETSPRQFALCIDSGPR